MSPADHHVEQMDEFVFRFLFSLHMISLLSTYSQTIAKIVVSGL